MKKRFYVLPMLTALAFTTSCVNNDYDLSDIDTNIRVTVKDLTLPVKIEPVKLDNILDIEDGGRIEKINVNGEEQYAVVEKGTFESGEINIKEMSISKPTLPTISGNPEVKAGEKLSAIPTAFDALAFSDLGPYKETLGLSDETQLVHFAIDNAHKTIEFKSTVDPAVTSIGHLGVETIFSIILEFPGTEKFVSSYQIKGLKVYLPKGLQTTEANYNKETGIFAIDEIDAGTDLKVVINLPLTGIEPSLANATFENHNFNFKQDISAEGEINFYVKNINPAVTVGDLKSLNSIKYECNAGFTEDIAVKTFTGSIKYDVAKPNISPVSLTDLPDLLTQTGTKIEMANPQIYVSVTNPIDAKFGIHPKATLSIVPDLPNANGPFTTELVMTEPVSKFCLSPKDPGAKYSDDEYDYSDAKHTTFANLGKLLVCGNAGEERIPDEIAIDVVPEVNQEVKDFELKSYGKVSGTYTFLAPLALTDQAVICYDKTWEDWGGEDLDHLTVESAMIKATVTSDIPASITSETVAYLLGYDAQGREMRMKGTMELPANAKGYPLEIKLSGDKAISRIYGLELKVRATGGNAALSSSQTITVKDVKAVFSGYYDTEL